ncbi:MAG: hypothetical protein GJ680_07420 [Alteromonadaceae bacterium]|nr:hypothetical protein [Alteromonadaceae bacterium]
MKRSESLVGGAYSDYIAKTKLYLGVIGILGITNIMQLMVTLSKEHTVVVVPPGFTQEMQINEGAKSKEYQSPWAWSISMLLGNVDPQNADFVRDSIKGMLSPYLRGQLNAAIEEEARVIKATKKAQKFEIEDMRWSPRNEMFWVWGDKTVENLLTKKKDTVRFTYEIRVEAHNGMPRITYLNSYEGNPTRQGKFPKVPNKPYLDEETQEAITAKVAE